jgi:hypothetical protein
MIFVTAIAERGVVSEGFQIVAFPATRESARFLEKLLKHPPPQDEVEEGPTTHKQQLGN